MISADLGSELGEPDCPDFSASHSIDGQVDEASGRNLTRWNSMGIMAMLIIMAMIYASSPVVKIKNVFGYRSSS